MSLAVHSNNPNNYWQSLLQQGQAQSGAAAQSDPLSQLLATIGQATGATASATGSASSTAGTTATSGTQSQQSQATQGHHGHHHPAGGTNGQNPLVPTSDASATSSDGSTSGGANATGSSLIEQLMQMQAQLMNTTTPQSLATV